jgi:energy-coupling factor transport system ATP-binding protein
VWLGYILLSIGIFTLKTWTGLLTAALTVLALMALGRISLLRWRGILAGFVLFGAGFAALNAVRFAAPGSGIVLAWNTQAFFQTLFPFARTMTVLLVGLALPLIWTPLSVRRALEQLAARHGKVPAFWQRNVLIITLTLRFIPILLKEWERFGRIYLARGKETRKTPLAILRKLRGSLMPLLHALIRLADETAAALESRGVRRDARPVPLSRLRWKYRDYAVVTAAFIIAGCFIYLN